MVPRFGWERRMEMSEDGWRQWTRRVPGGAGTNDAQRACGDAAIGGDGDGGTEAPDAGPPRAFGGGAQSGAAFLVRGLPGAQRGHGEFAVALVGVAMAAEIGEEEIGGWDVLERVGSEQGGDAVLPVLVAALDFGSPAHRPPYSLPPPRPLACGEGASRKVMS